MWPTTRVHLARSNLILAPQLDRFTRLTKAKTMEGIESGDQSAARLMPAAFVFAISFAVILILHFPLLRLPYFWDEAGYYIPAARDLFLSGTLIPHSTPSNAHPPVIMAYLSACWKIAGYSLVTTRVAMLVIAAVSITGLAVSYTHLRAHETPEHLVCRL